MPRATVPKHGPGCRPLAGTRSVRFPGEPRYVCTARCPRRDALAREYDTACVGAEPAPLVLVTFKDEGADGRGRFGPVVVIRVERPTPEAAAAAAAGVPFPYEQRDATDLGWLSEADARAIAADHEVPLTFW